MKLNEIFGVKPQKRHALIKRIYDLHIDPNQIEESFIKGSGRGGQKINKTANAVRLVYKPFNLTVKVQRERDRSLNRFFALRELADQIEMIKTPEKSKRLKERDKIRRQKDRRRRRSISR